MQEAEQLGLGNKEDMMDELLKRYVTMAMVAVELNCSILSQTKDKQTMEDAIESLYAIASEVKEILNQ
jgi:diaminopimelate decarboxylase